MSNAVYLNPNFLLENISPVLDDEAFLVFLELYYEWLQTTELSISSVSGTFQKDEIVIGSTSGARGIVRLIKDDAIIVKATSLKTFDLKETLTGQISSATASLNDIKDNVLKHAANLLRNKIPEFASGKYLEYLKSEFNNQYPTETETDRRQLVAKLRNLYESKSTEEAYRFLFRTVFGENIEFRYPGEELLRVSDGKFEKTIVLRVVANDDIFGFLNETIRGATSGAVGNVVDIKLTFLGGIQFAEFTLSLVSGTFSADETIFAVNNTEVANTTTYGMLTSVIINDGGSGYNVGDSLAISGDGFEASASVSSVSDGPINKIKVNNIGYGYRLGTLATVNNAGTGGSGLYIKVTELANTYTILQPVGGGGFNQYNVGEISKVSILNRGSGYSSVPTVTLIDSTVKNLGSLHENLITIDDSGNNYSVGDSLVFSGGSPTTSANGVVASVGNTEPYGANNILFEDSFVLIQETTINGKSSALKGEDWTNNGPILRIELYDSSNVASGFGFGYSTANLSSVSISVTSGTGTNAQFTVEDIQGNSANVEVDVANNSVGIGSIRAVEISDFGIDYSSVSIDATISGDGNANLTAVISGTGISSGRFINDDGKIDYKIIQDSLFYQDFSYVIKSALTLNRYDSIVKELIHPAGLEFFGEISIQSIIGGLSPTAFTIIDFPSAISSLVPIGVAEPIQSVYKRYRIWGSSANPVGAEFRGNVVPIYIANSVVEKSTEMVVTLPTELQVTLTIVPAANFVNILELYVDASVQNIESIVRRFSELEIYVSPAVVTSNFVPKTVEVDINLQKRNLSIVNDFSNYKIEVILDENVSVNPVTELEVGIDLPISVEMLSNDREIQIEISPSILPGSISLDAEYVNRLELYFDLTTAWYSQIQVVESATKIELEVILDGTNLQIANNRELQVKIAPAIVPESLSLDAEYVNRLELYLDLTTAWYSQIQVVESATKIELEVILDGTNLQINDFKELQVKIAPAIVPESLSLDAEYIVSVKNQSNLGLQFDTSEVVNKLELQTNLVTVEYSEFKLNVFSEAGSQILSTDAEYVNKVHLYSDVTGQIEINETVAIIELETNLQSDEFKELRIEFPSEFLAETLNTDSEYVNKFQLETNVETNNFIKYEIDIIPEPAKSTQYHRETILRFELLPVSEIIQTITERVNILEIYVDATTTWESQVKVLETVVEIVLDDIILYPYQSRELILNIPLFENLSSSISAEYVNKIPTDINLFSEQNFVGINKVESEIASLAKVQDFNPFRNNTITYGDTTIATLANRPIQDEQNKTFESEFGQKSVTKNVKISGTITISGNSVIGTGTSFTSDYSNNSSLIVGSEKFIITGISNTEFMTINVNPAGTYSGASAYKEVAI